MNIIGVVPAIKKFFGKSSGRINALSKEEVYQARLEFKGGNLKISDLAKKYNVSVGTMYSALAGRGAYENI